MTSVAVRVAEVDVDDSGGGVGVGRVGWGVGRDVGCLDGRSVTGCWEGRGVGRRDGGDVGRLEGLLEGRLVGRLGRMCFIVIMDSNIVIGLSVGSKGRAVGFRDGIFVGRLVGDNDGLFVGGGVVGGAYDSNPSSHCGMPGFFVGLSVGNFVGYRDGRRVGFFVGFNVGRFDGSFVGLGVSFREDCDVLEEPSVMMVGPNTSETLICSLAMSTASSCSDDVSGMNSGGRFDDASSSPVLFGDSLLGSSVFGPAPLDGGRATLFNVVGGGEAVPYSASHGFDASSGAFEW